MKTSNYILIALTPFFLIACTSHNNQADTDLVQYQIEHGEPLDGPIKRVVLNTENFKTELQEKQEIIEEIGKSVNPRLVDKRPKKTLDELGQEITLIYEQGANDENAAMVFVEYADALVVEEIYSEAINAYKDAETRGYKDLKNLYFKIARAYALEEQYYGSVEDYLKKAQEHGFRNYRALLYDPAFEKMRTESDFMYYYNELFGDNKKAMFKAFVVLAPKSNLTKDYILNTTALFEETGYAYRDSVDFYTKHPVISGYYETVIKGISNNMFSREGGDTYRYEMMLADNPNYMMVIYSKENSWADYLLPKTYKIATYDWEGNIISELEIARKGSLKKCKTAVLKTNKTIVVTNHKITWKKGTKIEGTDDRNEWLNYNDLGTIENTETKTYFINENGRILESEPMVVGMR